MLPTPSTRSAAPVWLACCMIALLLPASGCALLARFQEQPLAPPADAEGQACVARCELSKSHCMQRQQARQDECARYLTVPAGESCTDRRANRCLPPDLCLESDSRLCETRYEECALDCGDQSGQPGLPLRLNHDPAPAPADGPAS